jgi:uncharacterized membrane protein
MESRANIAKRPIHVMLVGIPIGLWVFSLISDLIYLGGGVTVWKTVAYYTLAGGIVGAIVAAVFGLIDYSGIKAPNVKRLATAHMILNVVVLLLFTINLYLRYRGFDSGIPVTLSVVAIAMLGVSGWLGATMVHVLGQSVWPVDETVSRELPNAPPTRTAGRTRIHRTA